MKTVQVHTICVSCSKIGHLLNIFLFYLTGANKRLDLGLVLVTFPGKQESFSKNVYTVCWSMWSEVTMQS